jgi:hypothetical protein
MKEKNIYSDIRFIPLTGKFALHGDSSRDFTTLDAAIAAFNAESKAERKARRQRAKLANPRVGFRNREVRA